MLNNRSYNAMFNTFVNKGGASMSLATIKNKTVSTRVTPEISERAKAH